MNTFLDWAFATLGSSGLIVLISYLYRESLSKFFTKYVEDRFERKMEIFKGEIREKETELDRIMTFLVSAKRERDAALQSKKMQAAEAMLRSRQLLSRLTMLVEYMKILKIKEMQQLEDDESVADFVSALIKPFKIEEVLDELRQFDHVMPGLYLSEATVKRYEIYKGIIISAATTMKLLSFPIKGKREMIKEGNLGKLISDLMPITKEGFDKWGESFAFHWCQYFYDEILSSLRREVAGADDDSHDSRSIEPTFSK